MTDADATSPGARPDDIYENAYRNLIKAAIEFGRADEHRGLQDADEIPQPVPVQISEAIILELWEDARSAYDKAPLASDGYPDALGDSDQVKEWECQMEVARLALLEVMDNLYTDPDEQDDADEDETEGDDVT